MIESFAFRGFRGSRGEVRGLRTLNVLIGPNNSGKSTALEALSLLVSGPNALEGVLRRRSSWLGHSRLDDVLSPDEVLVESPADEPRSYVRFASSSLSNDLARLYPSQIAHLSGYEYSSSRADAQLGVDRSGVVYTYVLGSSEHQSNADIYGANPTVTEPSILLGAVDSRGQAAHAKLIEFVQRVDPSLRDIHAVFRGEDWHVHAQYDDRSVPIAFAGDGMKTLFAVACAIIIENDMVLLEEPECFLHGGVLRSMADLLWHGADAGKQIVLTTHSYQLLELLQERREDVADRHDKMAVIEFSRSAAGQIEATTSAGGPSVLMRLQGEA